MKKLFICILFASITTTGAFADSTLVCQTKLMSDTYDRNHQYTYNYEALFTLSSDASSLVLQSFRRNISIPEIRDGGSVIRKREATEEYFKSPRLFTLKDSSDGYGFYDIRPEGFMENFMGTEGLPVTTIRFTKGDALQYGLEISHTFAGAYSTAIMHFDCKEMGD